MKKAKCKHTFRVWCLECDYWKRDESWGTDRCREGQEVDKCVKCGEIK